MFAVVSAVAPDIGDFIAGKFQSREHFLIGEMPVAAIDVEIVGAVLQKNADGFWLSLADQGGIIISTAQTDISADGTKHAVESVRPLPSSGEGGDGSGTGTRDGVVISIGAQVIFFGDFRQQFFQQKTDIIIAEAIVFVTSIETIQGIGRKRFDASMHDEDANGNRHFLTVDQIVENDRCFVLNAVLKYHQAGGFGGVILLGHIDPIITRGPGKNYTVVEGIFGDFAFRHTFLRLGIGAGHIVIRCVEGGDEGKGVQADQQWEAHRFR